MAAGAQVAKAAPANDFSARNALFFDATAILLTIAALITVICTALTAGMRRHGRHAAGRRAAAGLPRLHQLGPAGRRVHRRRAARLVQKGARCRRTAVRIRRRNEGVSTPDARWRWGCSPTGPAPCGPGRRCVGVGRGRAAWSTYAVVWPFAGSYVGDNGQRHNNLWKFVDLNQTRGADWDSLAYVVQYLGRTFTTGPRHRDCGHRRAGDRRRDRTLVQDHQGDRDRREVGVAAAGGVGRAPSAYAHSRGTIPPSVLNTVGIIGALVLFAGIGFVVLSAPRRPRVPQVAFLVVVSFLLVNKVDSPQYSLWLLPLAVLAYPRWKPLLAWQIIEIYEVIMRYLWFVYRRQHGVRQGRRERGLVRLGGGAAPGGVGMARDTRDQGDLPPRARRGARQGSR